MESSYRREWCSDQGQTWFLPAHHPRPCESEVVAEVAPEVALEVVLVAQEHQCDLIPAWICHHLEDQVVA